MCDGCKKATAIHTVTGVNGKTHRYCPVCFLILGSLHKQVKELDGEGLIEKVKR